MMNNNHRKSGCGFDVQLVSYLYDENGAAENAAFEKHLAVCENCADELDAFGGVKFAIGDWKSKDFAMLAAPVIEIPYEKPANRPEVSAVGGSWLSGLRNLFSLSPKWSLAAASAAVLAICVGIIFFALNSGSRNLVAESNRNSKLATAPTVENSPEKPNNTVQNDPPEKEKLLETNTPPVPAAAELTDEKNKPSGKTPAVKRQPSKAETNARKNDELKRRDKNKTEVPPKIFDDEDEDDSLRLAELFEEIDTIE